MITLFASQELWEFVEDGFEEPTDENEFNNLTQAEKELLKSYKKKDSKALLFLYQVVHESVFPRIAAAKTSKEAWQTLKTTYQGMEKLKTTKLQLLKRDFENLCMKESDNIDSFFTQNKPLRPRCPLEEEEVKVEETREEGVEAKTEVEETDQQIPKEEAAIQIRTKAKAAANKMDNIMLKDKGNIALFSKLDQSVKSQVTLGTDSKVSVMGKGEVNILTKKGEKKTMADVYYVPGIKCNLLRIGQLVQKGYNVFFENDVCTIMDRKPNKLCIVEVKMTRNRMFPLRIKAILKDGVEIAAVTQEAFQSEPKDEHSLWNLRFGHLNFGGLNLLSRKGMVRGLPVIEKLDSLCEGCILGKQHRESFPSRKSIRAKAPLEIIHSDVCGPMKTPSLAGSLYILTFIDHFTRKTWVYFLKKKSEVFEKFRNFKALVENQSGLHIKVLRTDRGGEYISK
eukprot:PITA_35975